MNAVGKVRKSNAAQSNSAQFPKEDEVKFAQRLEPGEYLSERQKTVFRGIVSSFKAEFFSEADRYVLEAYCRLVEAHEAASERFAKQGGMNPKSTMVGMRKGVLDVFLRTSLGIASMSQRLRANPSSRTPVHVAKANGEEEAEDEAGATFLSELRGAYNA